MSCLLDSRTYDQIDRLNGFTHAKPDGTVLMHQDWSYSPTTGLKNVTSLNVPNLATVAGDTLATAYDTAASGRRLASETLKLAGTQRWSQTYGYDNAENRTSLNLSGTAYTFGYNGTGSGQNRETSVSSGTPLGYDFKGNVTSRTPLAGGNPYAYTWNCYDQLTHSTCSGMATVDYTYDPLGRMIKRAETGGDTTLSYWLGGCKIAEARWGSEYGKIGGVLRPDPNESGAPTANGWGAVTGTPDMHYETDGLRGTVLRLKAATTGQYDLNVMNGDYSLFDYNPNDTPFLDTTRRHVGFWVKNNKAGQAFEVMVALKGASGNLYCLRYYTDDGADSYGGAYLLNTHIGTRFNNGGWHYVEVDVGAKFAEFSQTYLHGEALAELEGVAFLGNDLSLDDLAISGTAFCRSYQVVPGATVGGVLGGYALDAKQAEDRWYYQYNELGTVVATAWSSGNPRSLDVPDYFGNYRAGSGGFWGARPDTMGLTGKFKDDDSGLYYFGARWFDPERGRWMSEEPLGLDGPNPYQFCFNNPAIGADSNGLLFGGLINAGEGYGEAAVDYYANITTSRCASGWAKAGAYVAGPLAALWTRKTSDATLMTLVNGYAVGSAITAPGFLKHPLLYELGQTTVSDEVFTARVASMSPVKRGLYYLNKYGYGRDVKGSFLAAYKAIHYPRNFIKTVFTGVTPAVRLAGAAIVDEMELIFHHYDE